MTRGELVLAALLVACVAGLVGGAVATSFDAGVTDEPSQSTAGNATEEQSVLVVFSGELSASVEQLQRQATESQATFTAFAETTEGVSVIEQFWLVNAALVSVEPEKISPEALTDVTGVERIENNSEVRVFAGSAVSHNTSADADATRGVDTIGAPVAWQRHDTQGGGVSVAVLDTGVDASHPDIDLTEWAEFDQQGEQVESDPQDYDADGHGTHVSGTVTGGNASGEYIGVAPEATLYHGAVLTACGGSSCVGTQAQILGGMEWAVEHDVDVLSMSLGRIAYDKLYAEAVRNAEAAGTTVVAAIGNEGAETSSSPANVYEAISVGASVGDTDVAGFSGGEHIDTHIDWADPPSEWPKTYVVPSVTAPGTGIESSLPDGEYGLRFGTSMATPHVAGSVVLAQAATEPTDRETVERALEATATKPPDTDVPAGQRDTRFGAGVINVSRTIDALSGALVTTLRAEPLEPAPGENVTFDASGTFGNVTAYEWDVTGNGTVDATGETVTHSFTAEGMKNVTLTVTDDSGESETTTRRIPVSLEPTVSVEPERPQLGEQVRFNATATDGSIESYEWAIGDNATATGETVTHTFDSFGDHPVTLSVTDSFGNTASETVAVSVRTDWQVETDGAVEAGPTVVNETVFAGDQSGDVRAIDKRDGSIEWEASVSAGSKSSPTVSDGRVVVADMNGTVSAFGTQNGTQLWATSVGESVGTSPTLWNETVFIGTDDGLTALAAENGTQRWNRSTPVSSSPTVVDETVVVGVGADAPTAGRTRGVMAFDRSNGSERWTAPTASPVRSSPTVWNETVFIGSDDGTVYGLSLRDGTVRWSETTDGSVESSPTVWNETVFIGNDDRTVYAFDATTGTQQWHSSTDGPVRSSPTIADGTVFVGSDDTHLYAFDATTGDKEWRFGLDGPVQSAPTVAESRLFVGTGAGVVGDETALWALGEPVGDSVGSRVGLGTLGHHHGWLTDGPLVSVHITDEPVTSRPLGFDASNTTGVIDRYEWDIGANGTVDATGKQFSRRFEQAGTYDLRLAVTDVHGRTADRTTTVEVVRGPPPIVEQPPTDLTGDGNYEDLTGNENLTIADVQTLFDRMEDETVVEYAEFFDFAGISADTVSIFDVQALFNRLQAQPALP